MHAVRLVACFLAVWTCVLPLAAKTLTFDEQKCRCEVPDSWTEQKIPGNQASFINADQTKSLTLRIAPVPDRLTLDSAAFINGFEGSMVKNGATITSRQHVPLGGIDAYAVDSTTPAPAGTVYNRMFVTLANGFAYGFNTSKLGALPTDDDELNAITKSFAFIGTPVIPTAENPMEKFGTYVGFFIAFLAVISLFKWLRRRGADRLKAAAR